MKINFQKLFSVMLVLCVSSVVFCVTVSADTSSVDGGITSGGGGRGGSRTEYGNGLNVFFETLEDFTDGNITYDEFNSKTSTILEEYAGEFSDRAGITLINDIKSQVNDYVTKYGKNAPMYIYDSISDILNNYETTETIPTTDKKGYGACIKTNFVSSMTINTETYGDYIVLYSDSNGNPTYSIQANDGSQLMFVKRINGGESQISYSSGGVTYSSVDYMDEGEYIHVYGDVRNSDGTPAKTDDTYVDQLTYDFSNATDSELDELLQELKEELERQNPDLSTMEGLLESIYYRLGSLDSDNDNALLSQVIVAVKNSSGELKTVLEEIRDSLTDGKDNTDGENEDLTNELEKHLTVGDFVIDEEAYRNNSEVLKLRLQEKFIFADKLKELITYTVNSYSNSSENPQLNLSYNDKTYSMDFSAFDEHIPTIRFIIAAFTYITFAFHTYRKIPSYINGGDNE